MNSDQWLSNGDCKICRREKYCSKPCTKVKKKNERILRNYTHGLVSEIFKGKLSGLEEEVHRAVDIL